MLRAACQRFGVTEAQLFSAERGSVSPARWALSYVLTQRCGWSCLRVADLLHKDHTSVLYGVRRAIALRRSSEQFFDGVQVIEDAI